MLGSRDALALGAAALVISLGTRRAPRLASACAIALFVALGASTLAPRLEAANRASAVAPIEVAIDGRVCVADVRVAWVAVELCEVAPVAFGRVGAPAHVAPALRAPARVRLTEPAGTVGADALSQLRTGEAVRLRVALRPLSWLSNPGSRDRTQALARRGVGVRARLVDAALLGRIPERDRGAAARTWLGWRARLGARLGDTGPGGPLLRALATGDRSAMTPEQAAAFAALGLGHLLAVSGLHLTLVASAAFAALRAVVVRMRRLSERYDSRPIALCGAVLVAAAYALLAGWGVPVQRALVFVAVVAARFAIGRAGPLTHTLGAAGIAVATVDPTALFAPGAQLSFVATAAVLAAVRQSPPERGGRPRRFLAASLRVSAAAIVATAPLLAWHGLSLSSVGLVANVVAVPWTAFVLLPAALGAAAVAALPLPAAWVDALLVPGERAAALTLAVVDLAGVHAPTAPSEHVAGWAVALAAALGAIALRARTPRVLVLTALIVPLGLRIAPSPRLGAAPPRLVAFDVGMGDALLLQGVSAAVLVDGGWAMPVAPAGESPTGRRPSSRRGPDLGRVALLPALHALGVERLDLVVVSHGDLDHRGGLVSVLSELRVDTLWLPHGGSADADFAELLAVASRRGVVVEERGADDATRVFGDVAITPLWPPRSVLGGESRNDRSLVVRANLAGVRVLATGDIGRSAEARLIERAGEGALRADVLKLAHHGSRSSSSVPFLAAVAPAVAIASAPCGGRVGLPTAEALARTRARGAAVWWTGRDGAVSVSWSRDAPLVVSSEQVRDRCHLR